MPKLIDMKGQSFGRFVVLEKAESREDGALWLCLCVCGKRRVVSGKHLRSGHSQSCGCLTKIHGMTHTREFASWTKMRRRCLAGTCHAYSSYGGRGIAICKGWDRFNAFYSDMGPRPEGTSLDRIDNNGDYCPENCRWATPSQQQNNKKCNRHIVYRGVRRTLSQWSRIVEIPVSTLWGRMHKGRPVAEILGFEERRTA